MPETVAIKRSQNYTVSLATQLPSQGKGSASPPQGLSKSREMTAWPKAGTALALSDRKGFTAKKRVCGREGNVFHSQVSTVPGIIPQRHKQAQVSTTPEML